MVLEAQTPSTQHPSEHTSGAPLLCKLRHHLHHLQRPWKATAIIPSTAVFNYLVLQYMSQLTNEMYYLAFYIVFHS